MKRKVLSLLVVMAMLLGVAMPAFATEEDATQEIQCKTYLTEEAVFDGTVGTRVSVPSEDVSFWNGLGSATWTATFKTSSTSLQSLMVINGPDDDRNYISFYLNSGNRLGVEIRDGANNDHRYVNVDNFADGEWHTATFTVSKNQYYKFYLDQELVLNLPVATTNFTQNLSWTPSSVTFGGAERAGSNPNNYLFTGSIKNVKMYNGALGEEDILIDHGYVPVEMMDPAFQYGHMDFDGTNEALVFADEAVDTLKAMDKGTLSIVYKLDESAYGSTIVGLLSLSHKEGTNDYGTLYLKPKDDKIGIEVRGGSSKEFPLPEGSTLKDGKWHTVTYVYTGTENIVYFDGAQIGAADFNGLFSNASWAAQANAVTIGGMRRTGSNNTWPFNGSINRLEIYTEPASAEQVAVLHANTNAADQSAYGADTFKTQEIGLFDMGDFDAFNYRIPALVTLPDGTLLAAADQRNQHWNDNGNIDSVVRRSTDGGKTWSDITDVLDLKSQPYNTSTQSAFNIDPSLLVETQGEHKGRVWMLVDMYPECSGTVSSQAGSGYTEIDGRQYLSLYDKDGALYTVREEGKVYNSNGELTDYVVKQDVQPPYHELGDLYQNGEYVGNIYLKSQNTNHDTAPLTVYVTSYLWLTYSDDSGLTWSKPVDLNPMVKEDWMRFCGSGPGVGLQLQNGTLMFPIYYTTKNAGGGIGFQSSANIYSTDGGLTWQRGESPNDGRINSSGEETNSKNPSGVSELTESQIVQLNNGHLMQFMRNYGGNGKVVYSISTDNGLTWGPVVDTTATEVYCQLSVVRYPELVDGKEIVVLSNPGGSGRNNGTLRIGEIQEDDSVIWTSTKMFCPGNYAYSCLTVMADGSLALAYEHENTIKFTSFNLEYIKDQVNLLNPGVTSVTKEVVKAEGNPENQIFPGDTLLFHVTTDQTVFTMGNPQLRFQIGGQNRLAEYASGGLGDKELTFQYVVREGDEGLLSFRPKIVWDARNSVQNVYGLDITSWDDVFSLGYVGKDPSIADNDIPLDNITATAGNNQSGQGPEKAFDRDSTTLWHTVWGGSPREQHYITVDLGDVYAVDGLRYQPRQEGGINGIITKYRIEVSMDGVSFTPVATGDWAGDNQWKNASFTPATARYVKLVSLESLSQEAGHEYTSAAEIRVTGSKDLPDEEAPTAPANVKAEDITQTEATITWEASSDNVGVTGYIVKNGETVVATLDADVLSYRATGLTAGTENTFAVYATDAAGNVSAAGSVTFYTEELSSQANKSTLETVLKLAQIHVNNGDVDKLVPSAREQFLKTLAGAQEIFDSQTSTQNQVDQAWKDLLLAIQGLGFVPGEKGELISLISRAEGLDLNDYQDGAEKEAFLTALADAKAVQDDEDAMEADIVKVKEALQSAMDRLVPIPEAGDKTELKKVIDLADSYDLNQYVQDEAAISGFKSALAAAHAVYDKEGAAQGEIDAAKITLINAMDKLQLRADKTNLNEWLEKLESIDLSQYTTESANAVREAIASARALAAQDLGKDEAYLIDAQIEKMKAAVNGLQPVSKEPGKGTEEEEPGQTGSGGQTDTQKKPATGDSAPFAALTLLAAATAGTLLALNKHRK